MPPQDQALALKGQADSPIQATKDLYSKLLKPNGNHSVLPGLRHMIWHFLGAHLSRDSRFAHIFSMKENISCLKPKSTGFLSRCIKVKKKKKKKKLSVWLYDYKCGCFILRSSDVRYSTLACHWDKQITFRFEGKAGLTPQVYRCPILIVACICIFYFIFFLFGDCLLTFTF